MIKSKKIQLFLVVLLIIIICIKGKKNFIKFPSFKRTDKAIYFRKKVIKKN